jgi:hypothetical protein
MDGSGSESCLMADSNPVNTSGSATRRLVY